ncbi:MAG: FAD-dependent oxidoreductase [Prolixibacteraceae bacterium]|nr:FAD-dependent oxidoreductase [Prolixibacteraceae bacterium]
MHYKVLTPARIGHVEIKNRVIVSSMCLYYSGKNGEVTDKMIAFFGRRAEAGIGAFILPANPHGENKRARGSLSDDSRIAQWEPLINKVHSYGAKIFCQIHPSGIQFGREGFNDSPFDISTEGIENLISSYAEGAVRAQKAGFDGVEIHGAHGHEVALLLSELLNTRNDKYGGSLENCARNITDMISEIKKRCGMNFPVILRISGEERIPGGRTIEGTAEICLLAEKAGVDAIHVSAGMPESEEWECPPSEVEEGHLAYMGSYLKNKLSVPVILVGRVVHWQTAEKIINEKSADFVAIARAVLADANWMKAVGNDNFPIRHCLGCNQGCRTRREQNKTMCECLQNPTTGREEEINIEKDSVGKKVCVIGGGLAGLESARIFALRGAEVHIYDSSDKLGGLFRTASIAPGKNCYLSIIEFYEKELSSFNVHVNLKNKLSGVPSGIWDLVVIATGGKPFVPPVDIEDGTVVAYAEDLLNSDTLSGEEYVVIGDGLVGYETADYLVSRGKKVLLIGNDPRDPKSLQGIARWHFMKKRFNENHVQIIKKSTVKKISNREMIYVDENGVEIKINHSYIYVLACGYVPDKDTTAKFVNQAFSSITVGNAEKSGDAMDSIHDAFNKARLYSFDITGGQ